MIKVENLVYEYPGKRVLDSVSFTLKDQSIAALVGPNGSGKTTLLRCLSGLEVPFAGQIHIAGTNVEENPRAAHRHIGYLSDFFGLYEDLTVVECLKHAALLQQVPRTAIKSRVESVIETLELAPYAANKAGVLSRGWRQRLGIAQALIHDPRLLILDEPASGLDPEARSSISSLFRKLNSQGVTLIVSSHILAELEDYCTTMLMLRDGKIIDQQAENDDKATTLHIRFLGQAGAYLAQLRADTRVTEMQANGPDVQLRFSGDEGEQQKLLHSLIQAGAPIVAFHAEKESLQDIYLSFNKTDKP